MDKKNNYHGIILISVVIIALATIAGSYFISKTNFSIQNTGTATTMDGRLSNTISVNGDGKVFATPDMVRIDISVSELASTSKMAQSKVNDKIAEILVILKNNGIPEKDIQTTELSLYPEYDWSSSTRILKGQRATQRLNIAIKKIDPKAEKVYTIIDDVTKIDKIEIGSISYDIEDKTTLYTQARELAFKKAQQKADELAKLGGVKLLKPVSISDTDVDIYYPPYRQAMTNTYALESSKDVAGGAQIPTGQLEISKRIDTVWGIQ